MSVISLSGLEPAPALAAPIVGSHHTRIAATPVAVRGALAELEPLPRLARALEVIGAGQQPVRASSTSLLRDERSFRLELWLDGRVTCTWEASLAPRGADATSLSVSTCVDAGSAEAMARVLDAWALLGPLVEEQTRRIARALRDAAEDGLCG